MSKNPNEITNHQMSDYYEAFCHVMGFKGGSWRSIIEFAIMVGGPKVFWAEPVRCTAAEQLYLLHPRISNRLHKLSGPHRQTLLMAYKAKRYSWPTRAKIFVMWPWCILGYMGAMRKYEN